MARRRTLLAVWLLATAAAATPALADPAPTLLRGNMPTLSQGRGGGTQRFAPAPVPNPNMMEPTSQRDPGAVQVTPGLTRTRTGQANAGDGFATGSAYSGDLEKRGRSGGIGSNIAPSLNLKLPLQVEFR